MRGRPVIPGTAEGELVLSTEPLSFWGGYDPSSGEIIDRRHPLSGVTASGCVLAIPSTRGSSTTTAVLLEAIRNGTAPAALLTVGIDTFLTLAGIVAEELYGRGIPIVALAPADFGRLRAGDRVLLRPDGTVAPVGRV